MTRTRVAPSLAFCVALGLPASAIAQRGQPGFDPGRVRELLTGPDGVVEIHQSTFDELAVAALPIRVDVPAPAPVDIPFCDEIARIDVDEVHFFIFTYAIFAAAHARGTWCGIDLELQVSSPADVRHDPIAREVRLLVLPGTARATVDIPFWVEWVTGLPDTLSMDLAIDLGGSIGAIPPIPIQAAELTVETPGGSRTFTLAGQDVELHKRNGFIELRGDVALR